jgi:hypothetical protein
VVLLSVAADKVLGRVVWLLCPGVFPVVWLTVDELVPVVGASEVMSCWEYGVEPGPMVVSVIGVVCELLDVTRV